MCILLYGRNVIVAFVCFEGMGDNGMVMGCVKGISLSFTISESEA